MIANSPNQSHNKHLQGLPDTPKTATTLLSDKDRQAAHETAKAADERPIPAVSDLAATSGTPPSFDGFEHGWILVTLCQGNLQKLYESDDLLGVFIYVIALHNTFKERAPALYEQSVQLRLAEAFAKFGMSGHNIESVLDDFLRRSNIGFLSNLAMPSRSC